jgi:glycosyltransferase involved in cell wall biosynthesis
LQERRFIRRSDLIITVSPSIGEWLQKQYKLRTPVTVLRNLPARRQPRNGPSLHQLAGLQNERVIVYTGRITSGRGLEEVVDALGELPQDLVLVLLGYGDDLYVRELRHRIERSGVSDRVRFVDPVTPDQVPAVASQADVALVAVEPVCLSYRFALPNKLFEAIQAGVPVLASDLPDMRRVVLEYGIGELFECGRRDEVRDGLTRTLAAENRFAKHTAQAAAQLHWSNEADRLLDAYELLLSDSPRTSENRNTEPERVGR